MHVQKCDTWCIQVAPPQLLTGHHTQAVLGTKGFELRLVCQCCWKYGSLFKECHPRPQITKTKSLNKSQKCCKHSGSLYEPDMHACVNITCMFMHGVTNEWMSGSPAPKHLWQNKDIMHAWWTKPCLPYQRLHQSLPKSHTLSIAHLSHDQVWYDMQNHDVVHTWTCAQINTDLACCNARRHLKKGHCKAKQIATDMGTLYSLTCEACKSMPKHT